MEKKPVEDAGEAASKKPGLENKPAVADGVTEAFEPQVTVSPAVSSSNGGNKNVPAPKNLQNHGNPTTATTSQVESELGRMNPTIQDTPAMAGDVAATASSAVPIAVSSGILSGGGITTSAVAPTIAPAIRKRPHPMARGIDLSRPQVSRGPGRMTIVVPRKYRTDIPPCETCVHNRNRDQHADAEDTTEPESYSDDSSDEELEEYPPSSSSSSSSDDDDW